MSKKIKLNYSMSFFDYEEYINPSFAKAKCAIAYVGDNRNKSSISKDTFDKALPSLKNVPIVGNYDEKKNKFGSHDVEIKKDKNGNLMFINLTVPFGVVPESAKQWYETKEVNGVEKEYLCTDVILWKRQYGYEHLKDVNSVSQSMEIGINDYSIRDDGYIDINDFNFEALCMLESAEPCYENAQVALFSDNEGIKVDMSSLDKFKLAYSQMINELKESGGSNILEEKENKKFADEETATTADSAENGTASTDTNGSADSSATGTDTEKGTESDTTPTTEDTSKKEADKEDDDDDAPKKKKQKNSLTAKYKKDERYESFKQKLRKLQELFNAETPIRDEDDEICGYQYNYLADFDEKYVYYESVLSNWNTGEYSTKYYKQEYTSKNGEYSVKDEPIECTLSFVTQDELDEIHSKYEKAKKELEEYKKKYSEKDFEELRNFKIAKEKEERSAKEQELYSRFADKLGNYNDFVSLWENKDKYSVEELEKECFCIFGRYELANADETETKENKKETIKFKLNDPLNEKEKHVNDYGGLLKKH